MRSAIFFMIIFLELGQYQDGLVAGESMLIHLQRGNPDIARVLVSVWVKFAFISPQQNTNLAHISWDYCKGSCACFKTQQKERRSMGKIC